MRCVAKDLQRCNGTWTPIHAAAVEYSDGIRRFKGPEGYATLDFIPTNVAGAAVTVTGMKMLDNSAAQIRWRLTGRLGVLPIDVAGAARRWRRRMLCWRVLHVLPAGEAAPARAVQRSSFASLLACPDYAPCSLHPPLT